MNCLPPTCAYRLRYEDKPLYDWHYLNSGSRDTVHEVGISVRGRVVSEHGMTDEEIGERIVRWPKSKSVRKPIAKSKR
jgi:hypothetical protein